MSQRSIDSIDSERLPEDILEIDTKIKALREEMNNEYIWNRFSSAFKILAVDRDYSSKRLALFYMTEDSLRENWVKLFGFPCDILARIMFIKMSKRKRCAKINFL